MLAADSPVITLIIFLAAAIILYLQSWRAVLVVAPSRVRIEPETPADVTKIAPELEGAWEQLQALGFVLLGEHSEKVPLKREVRFIDATHPTEPVVAQLTQTADGDDELTLLTRSERGFVVTSNFKRPAVEVAGRYLSGGLDGVRFDRVFKAHLRRLPEIGAAIRSETLDAHVDAVRTWFATSGKPELRQQHAVGLLWTLFALGMVAAALVRLLS